MVGYHGASAVEESILINDKGAGSDVSGQLTGGKQFQFSGGIHIAYDLTGKNDVLSLDVAFDLAFGSQNEIAFAVAVAGEGSVDTIASGAVISPLNTAPGPMMVPILAVCVSTVEAGAVDLLFPNMLKSSLTYLQHCAAVYPFASITVSGSTGSSFKRTW